MIALAIRRQEMHSNPISTKAILFNTVLYLAVLVGTSRMVSF